MKLTIYLKNGSFVPITADKEQLDAILKDFKEREDLVFPTCLIRASEITYISWEETK